MWDRFFRQRAYIGITRSRMRWYVRKIFPTASLHRDHSISYALVCEKGLSQRSGCVRYSGYYMNAHLLGERGASSAWGHVRHMGKSRLAPLIT